MSKSYKTPTPEYRSWSHMKTRCLNPRSDKYHYYGGRGIIVCERWKKSFAAFLEDMGPRPSLKHSLERRDVNGNYEPANCYWATHQEQMQNRRNSKLLTFRGETLTQAAWARRLRLTPHAIEYRLARLSTEDALGAESTINRPLVFDGHARSVNEWAQVLKVSPKLIRSRLAKGWTVERTLTTPSRTRTKESADSALRAIGAIK